MQQRHCLILQGTDDWLQQQAQQLADSVPVSQRLWLAQEADPANHQLSAKQAQLALGQEFSLIIFDARQCFPADAFGAVIGTLVAGGTLVILATNAVEKTGWQQRFYAIAAHYPVQWCRQGEAVPLLPEVKTVDTPFIATAQQQRAIDAVIKVATGHRRRPLVITADRGRGKTALLGMAAAQLLQAGKQTIVVTAPTVSQVETLFATATALLPGAQRQGLAVSWQQASIRFVAVDALLEQLPQADLLLVDEAAAIPAAQLAQLLQRYSRMVFSSTVHGYEGTGRGFIQRFHKQLDALAPGWRSIQLTQPIRWSEQDWLELFSYDALLLDAEPATDEAIQTAASRQPAFDWVSSNELLADDDLLRQVFGLMVLAHYRTRPSDMQMLLDRDDIQVLVLRQADTILASVWLVDEPVIADELAEKIFNGERRLKGQLIPQSLLAHVGLRSAGQYRYQRIIRIAVHPAAQQQGMGSALLAAVVSRLSMDSDVLGTSFAMDEQLLSFWIKNGFVPVRVGTHSDQVSGGRSVLMLRAITATGALLLSQARSAFASQWPLLLARQFSSLSPALVIAISAKLYSPFKPVETAAEVLAFAYAQRPYEASEVALMNWLSPRLGSPVFLQLDQQQQWLLVQLIMQNQPLMTVAHQHGLTGKTQVMTQLRAAVAAYLSAETR